MALVNQKTVTLEFNALYTKLEISLLNSIENLYFLKASKFLSKSWKKVYQWPALKTNPLSNSVLNIEFNAEYWIESVIWILLRNHNCRCDVGWPYVDRRFVQQIMIEKRDSPIKNVYTQGSIIITRRTNHIIWPIVFTTWIMWHDSRWGPPNRVRFMSWFIINSDSGSFKNE